MTITADKPKVLIVGAGLGGLVLGALLEKAKIPYTIFERATVVKPLGE
jgi:cation diffusion facilitator CzcD-associated flavoprotein CzcO